MNFEKMNLDKDAEGDDGEHEQDDVQLGSRLNNKNSFCGIEIPLTEISYSSKIIQPSLVPFAAIILTFTLEADFFQQKKRTSGKNTPDNEFSLDQVLRNFIIKCIVR